MRTQRHRKSRYAVECNASLQLVSLVAVRFVSKSLLLFGRKGNAALQLVSLVAVRFVSKSLSLFGRKGNAADGVSDELGRSEGEVSKALEMAKAMKYDNEPVETGVPKEKIELL